MSHRHLRPALATLAIQMLLVDTLCSWHKAIATS